MIDIQEPHRKRVVLIICTILKSKSGLCKLFTINAKSKPNASLAFDRNHLFSQYVFHCYRLSTHDSLSREYCIVAWD